MATVTSLGVCDRANRSGTRVSSWSLDGGPEHITATLGVISFQLVMGGSHTIVFNDVVQYQFVLDYGANSSLSSTTPPTIQKDNYWYDSGELVNYTGTVLNGNVLVIGWSLDDGPLHAIQSNSTFTVPPVAMTSSHVLHATISTSQSRDCASNNCNAHDLSTVFFDTNAPGTVMIQVDGSTYPATASFSWPTGSNHTIIAPGGSQDSNSHERFASWKGTVNSSDPVIAFIANGTTKLSLIYQTQYLTKLSFTDSEGNLIVPSGVVIKSGMASMNISSNLTVWLNYGTKYMVTTAMWQGINVAGSGTSSTFFADLPGQVNIPLLVYPQTIRVADAYNLPLAGAKVELSTVGGAILSTVTDQNGLAAFDVPYGMYYVSATFLGVTNTIWQGTIGSHYLTVSLLLSYPVLGTIIAAVAIPLTMLIRRRRHDIGVIQDMLSQ